MLEVEFCLMFYRFYDASSYQKVISWNLHASTDRFAKSPPDLRPNISCGQSKISRVGCEGNADELVKNHGRSIFFGILSLFVKNPNASWWQEFVHPKNLHCSNTFLPWNALKIATKFWRGSWLNDLGPPCYLSIFFIFLHRKRWRKTTSRLHNVAFGMASWPSTWLTAYDSACLFAKVGRCSKVMRVKLRSFFVWTWQTFFFDKPFASTDFFFVCRFWKILEKVRRTFLQAFAYASPKLWKLWFCSHWVPED